MKFVFIIQGEGRGHQTQAIAMLHLLEKNGHTVSLALAGCQDGKTVPTLMKEKFTAPLAMFKSPGLVYSKKTKALSISRTIGHTLPNLLSYTGSLYFIHKKIEAVKPDAILNFYDVLGGIYNFLFSPKARFYAIGHQYLLLNRHFIHPEGFSLDRLLVNTNTRMTCLGATKKLALSFSAFPDDEAQQIFTVTPLLRPELKQLRSGTCDENFLLIYLTQQSMAEEVIAWSKQNPETTIHCFTDKPQEEETFQYHSHLYFHRINSRKFLDKMTRCRGLVTTAGFESVCEAMLLDKPVMMIPVRKHYEQLCNASDARRAGAGIWKADLDIQAFLDYLQEQNGHTPHFYEWYLSHETRILEEIGCKAEVMAMA